MTPTLPPRPLRVQSDARLVQLARRGETAAFEALVRRYRRQLHGYCRRLGLGEAQAEDALQQGLLHAWRALRRGDEVRDVKSWMYRVVHNAALDTLRRSGSDTVELDESIHGDVEVSAAAELDRRLAVHATLTELAALPQMQREALVRTAVHGDSHEQVAFALGLSHAAVRGLVHRARLAMRAAAGALVPERLLQWLVRWWLGTGAAGTPELATGGGAGGGGMLAVLAKSGALLATGGVLAGGLIAVQHGHAGSHRSAARRGASASAASPALAVNAGGVASSGEDNDSSPFSSPARSQGAIRTYAGGPRSRSPRTPADSRRSIDLRTESTPTAAPRQKRMPAGGSTVQLVPVSVSPHRYARPQRSASVTPPAASAPPASPRQGGQTTQGSYGGRSQGGNVSRGRGSSTPGRSSGGNQAPGGTQHGDGAEHSDGDRWNAHVADSSAGSQDAGGVDGTPTQSGSGGADGSGGEGDGEQNEDTQAVGAEQGDGPHGRAPGAGGSGGGDSHEGSEGGASKRDPSAQH